jgi:hypothetical protein
MAKDTIPELHTVDVVVGGSADCEELPALVGLGAAERQFSSMASDKDHGVGQETHATVVAVDLKDEFPHGEGNVHVGADVKLFLMEGRDHLVVVLEDRAASGTVRELKLEAMNDKCMASPDPVGRLNRRGPVDIHLRMLLLLPG